MNVLRPFNGRPAHAPANGNIPIVGQPCEVAGFIGVCSVMCKCDGVHTFMATTTGFTPCPACGKGYIIQSVTMQPGQGAHVGLGIAPRPPQSEGEGQ